MLYEIKTKTLVGCFLFLLFSKGYQLIFPHHNFAILLVHPSSISLIFSNPSFCCHVNSGRIGNYKIVRLIIEKNGNRFLCRNKYDKKD
jgi:hypothetical protein